MYGIQVMYSKAHDALQYTLSLTYGMHEESFKLLPSFAYVLEQQNPGTITDLQCADDDTFLYFFMSLGSSIRGFRRCMRPVIAVDGDSENNLSWEWFLESLWGALGHIDDLVFISDRHASIEAGISKVFPYATHTICCWHFGENMKKRFHRKVVADIMDSAARTYSEFNYNRHMEELRRLHKGAFDYAIATSPYKWSRVHCPQRRNMLQKWFHDSHTAVRSMRHQLTDAEHLVILNCVEKCNYMTVNLVDWNIFSVKLKGNQWTVNLHLKTCTCNKFQMDHFPCSHALAAARERNLDFTSLCADYYKRETLIDAYSVPIMPVGHPS
ncbi:hypothetical protein QYF36_013880 [Acer negundo]|nr:hypothetical protein QYF36_013880 [Acer negundo]